jgi:hypothetical protein
VDPTLLGSNVPGFIRSEKCVSRSDMAVNIFVKKKKKGVYLKMLNVCNVWVLANMTSCLRVKLGNINLLIHTANKKMETN